MKKSMKRGIRQIIFVACILAVSTTVFIGGVLNSDASSEQIVVAKNMNTNNTRAAVVYPATIESIFPDKLLADAIANALGKQRADTVTKADLETVTTIQAVGSGYIRIFDLTGLEELTNLTHLDLSSNLIDDLSLVDWTKFPLLETLTLSNNRVSNVNNVNWAALTSLTSVALDNQVCGWDRQQFNNFVEKVNFITDFDGNKVPLTNVTDGGIYDATTFKVTWNLTGPTNLEKNLEVSARFDAPFAFNGINVAFNGVVGINFDILPSPTMQFLDWDNRVIYEEEVIEGNKINAPAAPVRAGYKFVGWTPNVMDVMPFHDLTFKAVYELVPSKPIVNVTDQNVGRTCQDDGYAEGYFWNGSTCVLPNGYVVPNTGVK